MKRETQSSLVLPELAYVRTLSILLAVCLLPGVASSSTTISQQPRRMQQQIDECPFHPDVDGYQTIDALQEDIDGGITGNDFILCPGIIYEQVLILTATDGNAPPLVITCADVDDTSESGPCTWQADSHIVLEHDKTSDGSNLDVVMRNVVFRNSKESSILVDGSGANGAILGISFVDCTWNDNFGEAVVEISNSTSSSTSNGVASNITVSLDGCVFDNNNVLEAILYTRQTVVQLNVENCEFTGNRGLNSIINLQDGATGNMHDLIMQDNTVQTPGLIYVEATARINETDICGTNNQVSGGTSTLCNGTFLQIANPDNCQDLNDLGCAPACTSYQECDEPTEGECLSTVEALRDALENVGGTIALCSDTTFSLGVDGSALEIGAAAAAVTLTCQDGGNCIIEGGTEQLLIPDGATDVLVEGIIFSASQESSIRIEIDPTEPALVVFKDCEWSNHDGGDSLITATYASQPPQEGDPLEAILQITNSQFKNNNVEEYLVENRVLRVAIEECTFEGNAGLGLVGVLGGETIIKSTFLENNEATSALFFVSIDSNGFKTEVICGASNEAGVCNGTHFEATDAALCRIDSGNADACAELCVPLTTSCDSSSCYSTWEELSTAIGLASESSIFEICENTRMELDAGDSSIDISQADTIVRCGSDGSILSDCAIAGGSGHFVVNASASFHGIAFSDASAVSVQVFVDLIAESAKVEFKECQWIDNSGTNTFEILHTADLSSGNRRLQADEQVYAVEISDSIFSNNIATGNTISNQGASLLVSNSDFNLNEVGGSVVQMTTDTATSTLVDVRFQQNTVNFGVVFIGFDTTLNQTRTCGSNNVADDIPCEGVFLESIDSEGCKDGDLDACRAACSSLTSCSNVTGDCFSEYSKLVEAVELSNEGETFVLCPASEFNLVAEDAWLVLRQEDTVLKCGEDGERSNRCVFFGGEQQLMINGTATGIRVEGVTFVGSSSFSIGAIGESDASATLYECEFSGHQGDSVIFVASAQVVAETEVSDDAIPTSESMELLVESCLFDDNTVELAPIASLQGKLTIMKTSFKGNTGLQAAGAVASLFSASLAISESCFVGNTGNVSGAILLSEEASENFSQDQNYGENNVASIGNCTDILTSDESLTCETFEAATCALEDTTSSPTTTGTDAPTTEPTGTSPTGSPAPTKAGGTLIPTSGPTILGDCYGAGAWEAFFVALRDSVGNEIFTICPETTINMTEMEADDLAPLLIQAERITLRCGSRRRGSCVLSGGTSHILLRNNIESLTVRYITMEQASEVSISGTQSLPFSIEFENCDWRNNSGTATIEIMPAGFPPGNDDIIGGRTLLEANDNFFVCDLCIFENNVAASSIIVTSDTTVVLDAVDFRANTANGSVISLEGGSILLKDSCVVASESATSVIEAKESEVMTEDVYFSGNDGSSCSGYVDSDGECVESNQSDSCIAAEKRCYTNWADLSDALVQTASSTEDVVLTLCENSALAVTNSAPIEISRSKTTIRCGVNGARDNSCLILGGEIQMKIVGTPTDVIISGITFAGASVAAIHAGGERSSKAEIRDCFFRDIENGQAAVLVYAGDDVPSRNRRLAIGDFTEPSDRSMTVEISYSTFTSNTVELAAIANLKGTMVVSHSKFDQNSGAAGGIGEWFGGSMSLSTSCFTENTGELAGSVYVDGDSTTESNNYSQGNEVTDGECLDLYLSTATESDSAPPGLCVAFSATTCASQEAPSASPTFAPTLPGVEVPTIADFPTRAPLDCIDDWENLRDAVVTNFTQGIENVYTLCPDATIQVVGEPILLDQASSDFLFECGRNGRLRDNCTIVGGERQFKIMATGIEVAFNGVSFEGSSELSILAAGDKSSNARFDKCQWIGHAGQTVVLIYSEAAGQVYDGQTPIPDLPLSDTSMTTSFEDCIFKDNPVTYAAIANVGGLSSFTSTAFESNMETSVAALMTRVEAQVELTDCCFIENDSELPGAVYLSERSELPVNENNYGFDNRVGLTTCTDIFTLAPDETCGNTSCPGTCSTFDSQKCSIPGYEYDVPSSTPSVNVPSTDDAFSFPSRGGDEPILDETSLFGSGFFYRNLLVGAIVAILGFGAFFYCKSTQGKKSAKGAPNDYNEETANLESAPAPTQDDIAEFHDEDAMIMPAMPGDDAVILDPDVLTDKKKKKKGGWFGKKKEKVVEAASEEFEPMVMDALVMPAQSYNGMGNNSEDRFKDERGGDTGAYLPNSYGLDEGMVLS